MSSWPLGFEQPALLLLLPLALLPWWLRAVDASAHSWLGLLPPDRVSELMSRLLRGALVVALACLVIGLADPYRSEYTVTRTGNGAEIVLVLDRSRSMDQSFAGANAARHPTAPGPRRWRTTPSSNSAVARKPRARWRANCCRSSPPSGPNDRFGMVAFSTLPMRVLDFTQKAEVIQAAITAGNIGRGLSETNIGLALQSALDFFDDRPYTGSRIIMLVSDGGDHLDIDARERIATWRASTGCRSTGSTSARPPARG